MIVNTGTELDPIVPLTESRDPPTIGAIITALTPVLGKCPGSPTPVCTPLVPDSSDPTSVEYGVIATGTEPSYSTNPCMEEVIRAMIST